MAETFDLADLETVLTSGGDVGKAMEYLSGFTYDNGTATSAARKTFIRSAVPLLEARGADMEEVANFLGRVARNCDSEFFRDLFKPDNHNQEDIEYIQEQAESCDNSTTRTEMLKLTGKESQEG